MPLSSALSTAEAVVFQVQLVYFPLLALIYGLANALSGILNSEDHVVTIPTRATGPGGRPLPSTKQKKKKADGPERPPPPELEFTKLFRRLFDYGTVFVVLTFFGNGAAIASHTIGARKEGWWCGEETSCYLVGGLFLHLFVFIMLCLRKKGPTSAECIAWTSSLSAEICILVASYFRFHGPHQVLQDVTQFQYDRRDEPDRWDRIELGIASIRVALLALLAGTYFFLSMRHKMRNCDKFDEEGTGENAGETTPLLRNGSRAGYRTRSANGSASHGPSPEAGFQYQDDDAAFYRPEKLPHKTWWEYVRGYSLFFPYLWPQESLGLKMVVLVCVIILIFQRIVNFLVPNQIGIVTDKLKLSHGVMPWKDILLFIFYKLNQGQSGLLGSVRALLWIPVSQFSYRQLTTAAFEHVHSLSLSFHTSKRTGELLSALNKGASINSFLEQITFQVFPMLIDLIVAIVYFLIRFGPLYATIATVITWYYLALTVMMAATRTNERRDMVNADREEVAVKNDSITSYETVKYFNAERYEFDRYRTAIQTYQTAEAKVTWGMNIMNVCQALVFMCGLLTMLIVGAYEVTQRTLSVGDFVVMITYLGQLQGPLNFFGTFYRTVQQSMISGERLLELFKIEPSVVDRQGVPTLPTSNGHIKWNHVHFAYEMQRTALRDLTFECAPGTTTAFVGESGGGKSTIFRLMFRYYNCQQGTIEIDGCNVKDVTIDSVRRLIGVVPQETILFNESIMYNLKYADQNITDDEVFEACRAASIHDRIMSFPEGYNTKVGDRGLRLSGGEKQRVAIARAMLKKPKIILLDEATSALDSETEQQIQKKLIQGDDLKQDRTLLIIAHRLSTITHADQILVLHDGAIVERGTHKELLALHGRYTSMWEKQSKAEEAASFARNASEHADRLMRRAHLTKKKEHEDRSDGFNSMMSSTVLQTEPPTPNMSSPARSEPSSDDESSATVRRDTRQKTTGSDAFEHETVTEEDVDFDGSTYGTSASDIAEEDAEVQGTTETERDTSADAAVEDEATPTDGGAESGVVTAVTATSERSSPRH